MDDCCKSVVQRIPGDGDGALATPARPRELDRALGALWAVAAAFALCSAAALVLLCLSGPARVSPAPWTLQRRVRALQEAETNAACGVLAVTMSCRTSVVADRPPPAPPPLLARPQVCSRKFGDAGEGKRNLPAGVRCETDEDCCSHHCVCSGPFCACCPRPVQGMPTRLMPPAHPFHRCCMSPTLRC